MTPVDMFPLDPLFPENLHFSLDPIPFIAFRDNEAVDGGMVEMGKLLCQIDIEEHSAVGNGNQRQLLTEVVLVDLPTESSHLRGEFL